MMRHKRVVARATRKQRALRTHLRDHDARAPCWSRRDKCIPELNEHRVKYARIAVLAVGLLFPFAARAAGAWGRHDWGWFAYQDSNLLEALGLLAVNSITWAFILLFSVPMRAPQFVLAPALGGFGYIWWINSTRELNESFAAMDLIVAPIDALPFIIVGGALGVLGDYLVRTKRLEIRDDRVPYIGVFALALLLLLACGEILHACNWRGRMPTALWLGVLPVGAATLAVCCVGSLFAMRRRPLQRKWAAMGLVVAGAVLAIT